MRHLLALARLVRLESTLLGFLSIFIPSWTRTGNLGLSSGRALPVLFTCMCAYISNDLYDREVDAVNHPTRPLPSKQLNLIFVGFLYFCCLGGSLFGTRAFVDPKTAFWYYGLVALAISYGYLLDCARGAKAIYVAAVTSFPVLILTRFFPEPRLLVISGAVFLCSIGRETCKDILDREGDPASVVKRITPRPLAAASFILQFAALAILALITTTAAQAVVLTVMTGLLMFATVAWLQRADYSRSVSAMRTLFCFGLIYLV